MIVWWWFLVCVSSYLRMFCRQWYYKSIRWSLSQVIVCSATLHSFDVKKLSERIMHFPTWVDLKGEDSVPETVHHVVVPVNPKSDHLWERLGKNHIRVGFSCLLKKIDASDRNVYGGWNLELSGWVHGPFLSFVDCCCIALGKEECVDKTLLWSADRRSSCQR